MSTVRAEIEPSMEDVLASIRRIISEDVGGNEKDNVLHLSTPRITEDKADYAQNEGYEESEDILDLTEVVTQDGSVVSLSESKTENIEEKPLSFQSSVDKGVQSMLSQEATLQTIAALGDLDKLNERAKESIQKGSFGQQTLEELVHSLLKPMLKAWMDAHLPSLVKWVVTEQIEKILKQKHENSSS